MKTRNWNELKNDEIYAIWHQYLISDGLILHSYLNSHHEGPKPMRLTPMEIVRLVDELLDRLEAKDDKELDSGCNKTQGCTERNSRC
jgi:hypothetical protein